MKKMLKNSEVFERLHSLKPLLSRRDRIGYIAARNYRFLSNSLGEYETIRLSLIEKYGENEVQKLFWGKENRTALDVTYYPSINEYQGRKTLQIVIRHFR